MKLKLKNVNYNKLFNVTDNKNGYYLIIIYKTDNDLETRKIYYNNTDIYLQNIKEIIKATYGNIQDENPLDVKDILINNLKENLKSKPKSEQESILEEKNKQEIKEKNILTNNKNKEEENIKLLSEDNYMLATNNIICSYIEALNNLTFINNPLIKSKFKLNYEIIHNFFTNKEGFYTGFVYGFIFYVMKLSLKTDENKHNNILFYLLLVNLLKSNDINNTHLKELYPNIDENLREYIDLISLNNYDNTLKNDDNLNTIINITINIVNYKLKLTNNEYIYKKLLLKIPSNILKIINIFFNKFNDIFYDIYVNKDNPFISFLSNGVCDFNNLNISLIDNIFNISNTSKENKYNLISHMHYENKNKNKIISIVDNYKENLHISNLLDKKLLNDYLLFINKYLNIFKYSNGILDCNVNNTPTFLKLNTNYKLMYNKLKLEHNLILSNTDTEDKINDKNMKIKNLNNIINELLIKINNLKNKSQIYEKNITNINNIYNNNLEIVKNKKKEILDLYEIINNKLDNLKLEKMIIDNYKNIHENEKKIYINNLKNKTIDKEIIKLQKDRSKIYDNIQDINKVKLETQIDIINLKDLIYIDSNILDSDNNLKI